MPDEDPQQEDRVFVIDGVKYEDAGLSFREQRELRDVVRNLAGDQSLAVEDADFLRDYVPAAIYLMRRRDKPDYTLDDALDCNPDDFLVPESKLPKRRRPTPAKTP